MITEHEYASITALPDGDVHNHALLRSQLSCYQSGELCRIDIVYPWLISRIGPIDWAAFIGSHIYARFFFAQMLSYATTDNVYSLTYRMIVVASQTAKTSYRYEREVLVTRVSKDLLWAGLPAENPENKSIKENLFPHKRPWLEEHRLALGRCGHFSLSNLLHITQLPDKLAYVVMTSFTLSLCRNGDNGLGFTRNSFMLLSLIFAINTLKTSVNGPSYFLAGAKNAKISGFDARIIRDYLAKLIKVHASAAQGQGIRRFSDESMQNLANSYSELSAMLLDETLQWHAYAINAANYLLEAVSQMSRDKAYLAQIRETALAFYLDEAIAKQS